MTTSPPVDGVSSPAAAPSASKTTTRLAADPVSRRLAELEGRLARLEGEGGPPASVASRLSRRLDALEAREHHHAQAVAHLEGRLATLLSHHLDEIHAVAGDEATSPSPARQAVSGFPPRPRRSFARRVLDGLHYLRYVWRRLQGHEEGAFPDQSLKEVLADEVAGVPSLGLVVLCQDDVDSEAISAALGDQTARSLPYVTFNTEAGRLGPSSAGFWAEPPSTEATEALRRVDLDYLVTIPVDELSRWPATLGECLQLSLAVEELDVLEVLLAPTLRVLVQRARDWHPLAHRSIMVRRGQVGKIVNLAGAPMAALLDGHFERRFGPYRFATAGTTLIRHRLAPSAAEGPSESGEALILSDDLLGGREQLLGDLFLRLDPTPWILVGEDDALTRQRLAPLQRVRRLDGIGSRIYPLGAMLPTSLRAGAVSWLARRWGAGKLVPLVSQDEAAEHPDAEPLSVAIASSLKNVLALRYPPRQSGAMLCHIAESGAPSAGGLAVESLRRQLDWQDARPVVLWFGDLLPERRPEDFLALAHGCRDAAAFLMVGRGPLEGSIDDLAGFLDLTHFRRLPSLPLSFAIESSHVMCSTSSREQLPYAILAAAKSRRHILLPEGSELGRRLVEWNIGRTYPPGDTDQALQALLQILQEKDEALVGAAPKPGGALWPSPEQVDSAWRSCLRPRRSVEP